MKQMRRPATNTVSLTTISAVGRIIPGSETVTDVSIALYTMDLFSSYMAYKHMWTQLSDMLKRPQAYKAVEKSRQTPDPIQTDPVSLDLARLYVRKALVEITNEVNPLPVFGADSVKLTAL